MLLNCNIVNCVRKRIDESKEIPNYSNYVILPNEGLIYSLKQHKFIGSPNTKGYWHISLTSDSGSILFTLLHRAIYKCINGDIPKVQMNNSYTSIPVGAYKNEELIMSFPSMGEAERNGFSGRNKLIDL